MSEERSTAFEAWPKGYGLIQHSTETIDRVVALAASGRLEADALYRLFGAPDRLTCAAIWTAGQVTYAGRVDLSGASLTRDDLVTSAERDVVDGRGDPAELSHPSIGRPSWSR